MYMRIDEKLFSSPRYIVTCTMYDSNCYLGIKTSSECKPLSVTNRQTDKSYKNADACCKGNQLLAKFNVYLDHVCVIRDSPYATRKLNIKLNQHI